LNSIREFNELDSFEIIYYKDFSYKTKAIRESVLVGSNQKGIWTYYDSTGQMIKEIDFGDWSSDLPFPKRENARQGLKKA